MVRKIVVGEIGLARQRLVHGKIATALEVSYGTRALDHAEELALHFTHGDTEGGTDKAVPYLAAAGRSALERFAAQEAADHLSAALDRLKRGGPQDESGADGPSVERFSLMEISLEPVNDWANSRPPSSFGAKRGTTPTGAAMPSGSRRWSGGWAPRAFLCRTSLRGPRSAGISRNVCRRQPPLARPHSHGYRGLLQHAGQGERGEHGARTSASGSRTKRGSLPPRASAPGALAVSRLGRRSRGSLGARARGPRSRRGKGRPASGVHLPLVYGSGGRPDRQVQEVRTPPPHRHPSRREAALSATPTPIRRGGGRVCQFHRRLGERNRAR